MIENDLAEELLAGKFNAGDTVIVGVDEADDGKLSFSKKETMAEQVMEIGEEADY